jgi:L-histidine Nalpha-methyltransferase
MHSPSSIITLPEAAQTPVGSEVFIGLTSRPKTLSPWLFYDEEGSRLFEKITELPEYYLTRTERGIFARHADEIIAAAAGEPSAQPLTMIELGAGTAAKTSLLLEAVARRQEKLDYLAIDVSESPLTQAKERIEREIPNVTVTPRVADYTTGVADLPANGKRRMVLYIGSSIGNFEPAHALNLLRDVRARLSHGDRLLLGVDRVKERSVLLRAYDDEAGVTEAFNKNVLVRINRELGGSFNPRLFRHRARWNQEHSRIEMHLESLIPQQVTIGALDLEVRFARGETIHTENSYKFTRESIVMLLKRAGFGLTHCWTDEREWFGVYLSTAGS